MKAAEALGNIKAPRAVEPLLAVLKDTDPGVRRAAPAALGEINGRTCCERNPCRFPDCKR
jgi:HEAT repeat protein